MKKTEVKVRIKALSSILFCKFLGDDERKNNLNPRDSASQHLYYLNDPEKVNPVYIPGTAIFSCLVNAGKFHTINGLRATTRKDSCIPSYLSVVESHCFLYRGYGSQVTLSSGWDVETNEVWSGNRLFVSHLPRVADWYCDFTLLIYEGFDLTKARKLVEDAGTEIGLLGFRPQKKGFYGKFTVAKWEPRVLSTPRVKNSSRTSGGERVSQGERVKDSDFMFSLIVSSNLDSSRFV